MDLMLRSCIWHPQKLASYWSGHVHVSNVKGKITAGLCEACHTKEVTGESLHSAYTKCEGCYGILDGLR